MNDNFDFYGRSDNNEPVSPSKIAEDYFKSADIPPAEEKTPVHLREDASKWDMLSNGQRRLIVFGALLAVILLLVLFIGFGSSCSGCGLCAGDDADDRTASDAEIIMEMDAEPDSPSPSITPTDAVPEAENPSATDILPGDEPIGADDSADTGTETDEATDEDTVQTTSDSDAAVTVPEDLFTVPDSNEADDEGSHNTANGLLSACSHEADNEAGSGTGSTHTGFLGFLFGCTNCSESCSVSFTESLTDPADENENDPDRDLLSLVSGSDADTDIWPQQPDDTAYIAMLNQQLTSVSDSFISLSELDSVLSQYSDPQRVSDNDRFRAVAADILLWCQGAEEYDASALTSPQAIECNRVSVQLAGHLRGYIVDYPVLISGSTSGTDVVDKADQINTIMADLVALYNAVNNIPQTQSETAE